MPGFSSSSSGTQIVPGMTDIYQNLLNLNTQNYSSILGAYGQGQANLANSLHGVQQGYSNLDRSIFHTLGLDGGGWGVATPAANAIGRSFAQARGSSVQNMINSGLGGSTLAAQAQNQNAAMASRAYGELGNQLANTAAGYQSQINQARLGAQMQGIGMQTSLFSGLGNTLGGYHFANTAGNLTGGFGQSQSRQTDGGGHGGYGGGGTTGSAGELGFGGLGATALGWMQGGGGGMGYSGAFNGGGYGGAYAPPGTLGGGAYNQSPLYDYDQGGNYGGGWADENSFDWGQGNDFGGGGSF